MLDRGFRLAICSFSTLFLSVAIVTFPFHVAHSFAFRDVIAVADLHDDIERFPPFREVRGVGKGDLARARLSFWLLSALEAALLPLLYGAARRAIAVEAGGGVPTVTDSLRRGAPHVAGFASALRSAPGTVLLAAAYALLIGFLLERIGLLVVETLPRDASWIGTALSQALARAVAVPFLLAVLVAASERETTALRW